MTWLTSGSSGSSQGGAEPTEARGWVQWAETAFTDEAALLLDDPDHSTAEDRFILLGISARGRLLVVVHTYRPAEAVIRIISARKADRLERRDYQERDTR